MSYLLDTCIISKLRKIARNPDEKLATWFNKYHESSYFISVLTIGEIEQGISKLNLKKELEKQKRIILENWFHEELLPRFSNRILTINAEVMLTWGKLSGEAKSRGQNIPIVDSMIAATAIVHDLTIVTENVDDFIVSGARVFSPWMDEDGH